MVITSVHQYNDPNQKLSMRINHNLSLLIILDPESLTDDHELLALRHWLPGLAAGLHLLVVVAARGA